MEWLYCKICEEKLSEFEHPHHSLLQSGVAKSMLLVPPGRGVSGRYGRYERYERYYERCGTRLGRDHPSLRPRVGEGCSDLRPKHVLLPNCQLRKNCAGNDGAESNPTAVDGNLLHENLQIWSNSSGKDLANLRSGYRWFLPLDIRGWT